MFFFLISQSTSAMNKTNDMPGTYISMHPSSFDVCSCLLSQPICGMYSEGHGCPSFRETLRLVVFLFMTWPGRRGGATTIYTGTGCTILGEPFEAVCQFCQAPKQKIIFGNHFRNITF